MKIQELIDILEDNSESVSVRDDAAMDLSEFNSIDVIEALLKIGSDDNVDDIILSSVGESIGEIWLRNASFNIQQYLHLNEVTKYSIKEIMKENFPDEIN